MLFWSHTTPAIPQPHWLERHNGAVPFGQSPSTRHCTHWWFAGLHLGVAPPHAPQLGERACPQLSVTLIVPHVAPFCAHNVASVSQQRFAPVHMNPLAQPPQPTDLPHLLVSVPHLPLHAVGSMHVMSGKTVKSGNRTRSCDIFKSATVARSGCIARSGSVVRSGARVASGGVTKSSAASTDGIV